MLSMTHALIASNDLVQSFVNRKGSPIDNIIKQEKKEEIVKDLTYNPNYISLQHICTFRKSLKSLRIELHGLVSLFDDVLNRFTKSCQERFEKNSTLITFNA